MTSHTQPAWPPAPSLTDERLAFLAVEPLLRRRSRTKLGAIVRLFEAGRTRPVAQLGQPAAHLHKALQADRMLDYVVAADVAAQELNADERAALRQSGALPEWFLPKVEEAFALHRAERKRHRP